MSQRAQTRVLVVESTWWWREAVLRVLERQNHQFEPAAAIDAVAARALVRQNRPHVAIIDLDHPEGSQLLVELREQDVPCVALSSGDSHDQVSIALNTAASYVIKTDLKPADSAS